MVSNSNAIKDECCKECGQNTVRVCSVCGKEYAGFSKDHLRTDTHKLYKSLFRSLRDVSESEIKKLVETYVVQKDEPMKPVEPEHKPVKPSSSKPAKPVKKVTISTPKHDSDSDELEKAPKKSKKALKKPAKKT
jgi:hypothetical protein